jgi:hypothetical protein
MTTDILLTYIDQAYDRRSWHGTNLRGSIRGVDPETAAWRPAAGRHNIWELVVHAAYWKYVVKRRLTGEPRGSFPMKGSNFIERPVAAENAAALWRADVALLTSMHAELRSAVAKLKPADLEKPAHGGNETVMFLVTGVAAHDLYHAGQIQLLKRLREQ